MRLTNTVPKYSPVPANAIKLLYADFPAKPELTMTGHHFQFSMCDYFFRQILLPPFPIMTNPVMTWPEGIATCFGAVNLSIDITVISIELTRATVSTA